MEQVVRRPLVMAFARRPEYEVAGIVEGLRRDYNAKSQTGSLLQSKERSWCTIATSTGNQLTGQDADSQQDD